MTPAEWAALVALLLVSAVGVAGGLVRSQLRSQEERVVWVCRHCPAWDVEPTDDEAAAALRWHVECVHPIEAEVAR